MTLIEIALDKVSRALHTHQVHPARTVVLVPFAQLLPLFASAWAKRFPDGFAPRFVTTQSWARQLGATPIQDDDFRFDVGLDTLTALKLLAQAKVSGAEMLAPLLVQACGQLVGVAAAVHPGDRSAWAVARAPSLTVGMEGAALRAEHAVIQLALAWAASSGFPTDVLWSQGPQDADLLVLVAGLQTDPLGEALIGAWDKRLRLDDLRDGQHAPPPLNPSMAKLFACDDVEDEALKAAACILRTLQAIDAEPTPAPVALVATDRVLTRRVRAMLDARGVRVRDETGWKLSTTRAAAQVISCLEACGWNASTDAVIDWLKNSPMVDTLSLRALERELRSSRSRRWQTRRVPDSELQTWIQERLETMQGHRSLVAWCSALNDLLTACGMHDRLEQDEAGAAVLQTLHMTPEAMTTLAAWPQAQKRMGLSEFVAWCRNCLESASYVPIPPASAQLVILPMSQLLGRQFSAVVIPGCDEVRFNPSPELPGLWLSSHRLALGLPSRDEVDANLRAVWRQAVKMPQLQLLWRTHGQEGEPLQLSPLVQQWLLDTGLTAPDLNAEAVLRTRSLDAQPGKPPLAQGSSLPVRKLSASAYADLRQCPYKFFALRQLRLKEASELDLETEKRDFGDWLHEVLKNFHEAQSAEQWAESEWSAQIDRIADACSVARKLGAADFLPYSAAWPKLRDGYLRWWASHLKNEGLQFASAETDHEMGLGNVTLHGRIDRIDHAPGVHAGGHESILVIDYKTESLTRTKERIKSALEDTQIAFYAALLPHDSLRAGYVNVGESDGTELLEQKDVVQARDALVQGILDDMDAIRQGAVMAALGEGEGCDYCAARGLCRKDHWEVES